VLTRIAHHARLLVHPMMTSNQQSPNPYHPMSPPEGLMQELPPCAPLSYEVKILSADHSQNH